MLNGLSLRDRIAQLILPDVRMWNEVDARKRIDFLIGKLHVGGLMFYKGTCERHLSIYNYAASLTEVPFFVAADAEWGLRMRLSDAPRFPRSMTLGATGDARLVRRFGKVMGRQCSVMGINVDFAPVLDVNSNPRNPIIGTRAYGENPDLVAELGVAFAEGLASEGVMPVAKHFPGHGDTDEDSHKTLPTVGHSRQQLIENDLLPFRRFVDSGGYGIMAAHLRVPALDESGVPSSMSHPILTDLLRGDMGFRGLVFSDALVMAGARSDDAAVKALLAGNDVLVMPGDEEATIGRIEQAVGSGIITQSLIDDKCLRILEAKLLYNVDSHTIDYAKVHDALFCDEAIALDEEIYSLAVTSVNTCNTFDRGDVVSVAIGEHDNECFVSPGDTVTDRMVFERVKHSRIVRTVSIDKDNLQIPVFAEEEQLLVEVFGDDSRYFELVAGLSLRENVIFVFYVSPYSVEKFLPYIHNFSEHTILVAYENSPSAQLCAQSIAFGEKKATGTLPVTIDW